MPFHPDYGWYDDGTDTNPNAPWDINVAARGGDPNAWWNIAAGNGATYSSPTSAALVGDMDAIEKIKQAGLKSGFFYEGEDDAGFGGVLKLALLAAGAAGGLGFLGTGAEAAGAGLGELAAGAGAGSGVLGGTAAELGLGGLGAVSAGSGAMDLNSLFPDFTNYTGEMTSLPGLEQSLTQVPLDLSTTAIQSQLAANPGLLDTITNLFKTNPTQAANAVKALAGAGAAGTAGTGGTSLLGTLLGGLLGSTNGAKQAGTTTATVTPWDKQQPYLLDAFEKAKAAAGGSPIQNQANANYQSVLSGPTKNPMLGMDNPYLTKAIDNANSDVTRAFMPAMNQANRASGSFGNSGVADTYGKNMADAYSRNATGMRMTDYTNQQQLQQQAVQNNLGFTQGANTYSAQPSQNYAQTVQGSYGSNQTTPYFNNPMSSMFGGALAGNQIGANLGF